MEDDSAAIRDGTDADSRSTLFNMLVRHRGFDAGLDWLGSEGVAIRDLTINGIQTLSGGYLQKQDFETLRAKLNELTDSQLHEGPYFRFLRAMVNVASLLPIPDRAVATHSFLMDTRRGTRSILDVTETATRLDLALNDLNALLPVAAELELREAKRLGEAYMSWCELLHPHRKEVGLANLRNDMKDIKAARTRLALAFAFDKDFSPKPLEDYLKRREELGGLDDDDLNTALIIRIHSDDPASVAALIARYRERFEKNYQDPIFAIEIQALAIAGDTASARLLLEKHRGDLPDDGYASFAALIAKMEGKDPVNEDLKVYEATKTVEALRTLVMSLAIKKDHRATAKYSEELYGQSSDPQDIARAAQAFAFLGDGAEFIRVIEAHQFLLEREPGLLNHYGWELFKKGRLKDSKTVTESLVALGTAQRDLQLEIAIAVESGEWESLAKPLAAFLDDVPRYSGLMLIRAAHIAQQSGQGPLFDLVKAAVSKADNDPHVWLAARQKLRAGGAAIVPLNVSEMFHAAARSRKAMSAEMRAIQESIDLARVAEVPTFPREIQWFADISLAVKAAVIQIWKSEKDFELAGRLSNLIMSTLPKAEDWVSRWEAGPPPEWVEAVNRVIVASLAMPIEIQDEQIAAAYNEWVELRSKVRAKDFTNDAFLSVIGTLQTSPEGFVQTIRGKVAARDLTNSDLLPDDARHWDI